MNFNAAISHADAVRASNVRPTEGMFAQAMFEGVRAAHVFWCSYLRPHIGGLLKPTERERTVEQPLFRIAGLLATLRKLDSPAHFQSISSAARTIFELSLDLALVQKSQSSEPMARIRAFTRVERLVRARRTVDFYDTQGHQVPSDLAIEPLRAVCNNSKYVAAVEADVEKYWGRGKNGDLNWPRHWSAFQDARARAREIGPVWEERYILYYRELSWHVHSGPAGVDGLPTRAFEIFAAQAYRLAGEVAVDAYAIAGKELRIDQSMQNWATRLGFLRNIPAFALADNRMMSTGEPARFLYLEPSEQWPTEGSGQEGTTSPAPATPS